jgi:hypothetical protein
VSKKSAVFALASAKCAARCQVSATLRVGKKVIAGGSASSSGTKAAVVTVKSKLTAAGWSLLRKRGSVKATLTVTISEGSVKASQHRTLKLRRKGAH